MAQWLTLAQRNVMRNGRRSLLLAGTIAVGTLALLLFIAYIAAGLDGLKESTIRSGLGHAQLGAPAQFDGYAEQQLQFGLERADLTRLETVLGQESHVHRIVPRLLFSGLVSNGPRTLNFEGTGVNPDRERQAFGAFQTLAAGVPLSSAPGARYQALIGKEMARRLAVKPGDSITLMTTTVNGSINAMDLEVAGLVATGVPEADLYLLQLPLETAQELLRTSKISTVTVLYDDTDQATIVSDRLQQRLGPHTQLKTWQQLAPLYAQVLALYRNQFVVFGIIIGIIVFLGVATMTLTTIYERAREIGTLRAMGISHVAIRRLFVYEGMLQGWLGALTGGLLAWLTTLLINAARIEMAAPPGRNVGVLLNLMWVPAYSAAIMCALPLIAMLASWTISRRISRMPITQTLSMN
ncbi:ABC transporter permease [Paraherbaspirillum soli]|uniref:ABC transporter permease n=1 Tax=Paraherbaspirillum soli TaxID=631222 RepID=A0ABW0MBF0_9BURK